MYSSDLRLRPLYIYMFSENFRGLPQPHQANTGLLLQSTMTTSCCTLCKWSTVKLSCAARVETLNIIELSWFSRDGLGLRRSVGSLSLRRPGFDPRPFHMSLVMHIMAAEIDFFSLSINPPNLHTHLYLHTASTRRTTRRSLKFHKRNDLSEMWNHWIDRYLVFKRLRKNLEGRLN